MPTAVVTGAASGIGNSFAKILLKEKYKVFACDVNGSNEAMKSLEDQGAITNKLDVRDPDSILAFTTLLADEPVDVLLNIAGTSSLQLRGKMYPD